MAITTATMTAATLAATALSTGVGVYSAISSSQAQQRQMEAQAEQSRYQAEIANRNQQLAEEEASAKRREGYENMTAKRQETAKLIGKQRAAMGASGAALDTGSTLDLVADTAEQGELDAINLYNRGIDESYRSQIQAWNYGQQSAGNMAAADSYDSAASAAPAQGFMNAAGTALGGIASMGSTWGNYLSQNTPVSETNWDRTYADGSMSFKHPSGKWSNRINFK